MSNIILASNVDINYFNNRHRDWIDSTSKNKSNDMKSILLFMGHDKDLTLSLNKESDIPIFHIPIGELQHSIQKYAMGNRKNFICLETGEFLNFINLDKDDILILCDYDMTMQRGFSDKEIDLLNQLGELEFAANLDDYTPNFSLEYFLKYSKKKSLFGDLHKTWKPYNTGLQAGRVSAWRNLFECWRENSDNIMSNLPYHWSFQVFFSYFIQRERLIKEMPETFHNAAWFRNTRASINDNRLVVKDETVLFCHHKWSFRPSF